MIKIKNKFYTIQCPCCEESIELEFDEIGNVFARSKFTLELSEDEIAKILKDSGIEFG